MSKEHLININNDNKNVTLKINGLFLFQGYQVMEAYTLEMDECYYLFFYKNNFLTGKNTTQIKRKSTLHQVLTKGISIPSPHPIIQSLLANHSIQTLPTLNSTWKSLNKVYSSVEAVHILTVFDSYLKKDQVISIIKKLCLQFRRDGKFLQAFRILKLAVEKYPANKWAKSLITHGDYQKYLLLYQSNMETLLNHDPLLSENQLHLQTKKDTAFNLLQKKIRSESRYLECLALYCQRITSDTQNFEQNFTHLLEILTSKLLEIDSRSMIYTIYHQAIPVENKEKIQKYLLTQLLAVKQYEEALDLLTQSKEPLSSNQINILISTLNHLDSSCTISFENFKTENLIYANSSQLDSLLSILLPRLFTNGDIQDVYHWLKPLFHLPSPLLETIKTMYKIREEPDQQHYMGELYYQLHQLPQAIDCFLWDVELNPSNPRPIKWLTKLYHELGMADESKSYQYLYKLIQKSS